MPEWLQELILAWLGPVGLASIVGFIIWLVQHNIVIIQHSKTLAKHDQLFETLDKDHTRTVITLKEVSLVLKQVDERSRAAEEHIVEHNREAEEWKRRIVALEAINEKNGRG